MKIIVSFLFMICLLGCEGPSKKTIENTENKIDEIIFSGKVQLDSLEEANRIGDSIWNVEYMKRSDSVDRVQHIIDSVYDTKIHKFWAKYHFETKEHKPTHITNITYIVLPQIGSQKTSFADKKEADELDRQIDSFNKAALKRLQEKENLY